MAERIAVIGLGYVGLPVALAFAAAFPDTIGFDVNAHRVRDLRNGVDRSGEVDADELTATTLRVTDDPAELAGATLFVVAVPTPIDRNNKPDLRPIIAASETVGRALRQGAAVVYESTVYPGVTQDVCGPVIARVSGLRQGADFKLGYSPERINPGDREHTLARITKIVSGEDAETLDRVAAAYGAIVPAGIHRAPTIRVAEAAKVIENTQRDLNIALMNELALIFDRLGIRTSDVLAAAGTKWNFLPFSPGLVGGHCIGVDPYYLTTKAEEVGYHPQVILAGRRINDGMGAFIAQRMVKLLVHADIPVRSARVGVLGLTFKENVPDMRNSRVPDIVAELRQFGIEPMIHDPIAPAEEAEAEYGLKLHPWSDMNGLDGLIIAVSHRAYSEMPLASLLGCVRPDGVLVDVKSSVDYKQLPAALHYWCL
jgi:UDP-N-acetyl-D-glucosamine/UDP-N-acetyl-D-galactosamine dehydrogenase